MEKGVMKKRILWIGVALISLALCLIVALIYISKDAQRLPDNNPVNFKARFAVKPGQKVVVCAGDSITHGSVSVNYVDILSRWLPDGDYVFVNAGINSNLAYNLNLRLDDIIRCNPDYITILIGTNDANASLSDKNMRRLIKMMNLPQKPDREWFRSNLAALCVTLKASTRARIALLSLPPIGEDADSASFKRAMEYSRIIKEVALSQKMDYLPLNEAMTAGIRARGEKPSLSYEGNTASPLYKALAKHYILRKSYDEISEENGFLYLTDLLHLNTRGATMVAGFVQDFITRK